MAAATRLTRDAPATTASEPVTGALALTSVLVIAPAVTARPPDIATDAWTYADPAGGGALTGAPLTILAFCTGLPGLWGGYIVSIGLATLILDLVYPLLDPRITYRKA